jgi:DNA-binding protein H-NS
MASYKELRAKAEEILRQAEEARKGEIAAVVAAIKEKMAEFGITVADLRGGARRGPKKATKVPPKYRDPATGQTWSGRGKVPKWLAAYMKKGRKKESYRIKGA